MIKLEKTQVVGLEPAIRGMRNPMNSWEKSDSDLGCREVLGKTLSKKCSECARGPGCADYKRDYILGENDLDLAQRLASAGSVHGKFRRMVVVYVDITAPLYWWKEFDTYKVGTVANSCSTMHKIHAKEFTIDDFSHEHLTGETNGLWVNADGQEFMCSAWDFCCIICDVLNHYRKLYLETNDKKYWWQMIQLLPSSYNQKRTVMMNYEVLSNIYHYRLDHKLDEWRQFCEWIKKLPYAEELIIGKKIEPKKELTYGEIYKKFLAAITESSDTIVDWRPYPLKKNSIIVWRSEYLGGTFKPPIEVAYQLVDEKRNEFHLIEDAKRLKDILEMEGKEDKREEN